MNGAGMASDPAGPAEPVYPDGPYAILRNRDFLFYLIGRFISSFGQQMLGVAIGWEIYDRTGSTLNLGFVGLVQMVPMFMFTFPAGHVADNYNRKKVMMLMLVMLAAASGGLALVSMLNASVAWMYAFLFLFGTART
jgi:MFS family permease